MSPRPARNTIAGGVYNDLRNLAHRQNRATDVLFQLYLMERFLYRLAQSEIRNSLVLKGGTLLAAYALRRPTQDVDVQARGVPGDVEAIAGVVETVCKSTFALLGRSGSRLSR